MDRDTPVFGYIRVSSGKQARSDRVSLPVQREKIGAYCHAAGLALVHVYEDHVSGRRADRPAYQEMIAALRRGEARGVICLFYDRFGRNVREGLQRVFELEDLGAQVVATEEPDPPGDRGLVRFVRLVTAEQQSDRISENVRNAVAYRKARGMHWGRVPYGWRRTAGKVDVDPIEAAVVRRMAELLLTGLSYRRVAQTVNAEGHRARGGQLWWPHAVGRFLSDPRYAGADHWPAILDAATFAACGERLAISRALPRGQSRASVHLLAGLLRCECGRVMASGHTLTRAKYISRYYVCLGKRDTKTCDHRQRHAGRLEQAIREALLEAVDVAVVAQRAALASLPVRDWASEQRQAAAECERCDRELLDNRRLYRAGSLSEQQLAVYNAETARRRTAAEQRLAALTREQAEELRRRERAAALPQQVRSLLDDWDAAPVAVRKAGLQALLARVTVYKDGRLELRWRGIVGE